MSRTDARDAVSDLVSSIKTIFRHYTRGTRKNAWEALKSREGNKVIEKIIDNPSVPTPGLPKLTFKEWLSR